MNNHTRIILKCLVVLIGLGALTYVLFFRDPNPQGPGESMAYFYDLSEKQLFAASSSHLPPVEGINDQQQDAVRAIVIRSAGAPDEPTHRRIAYLQKMTDKMKSAIVAAQDNVETPYKHTRSDVLVKRLDDDAWRRVNSAKGKSIISQWRVKDANGNYPQICAPGQ